MLSALLIGAAAGYAIAIPVGPIAILIVRAGLRRGFRVAAAAGAGAATVDLIYATAAVVAGAAIVSMLGPVLVPLRLAAAAVLVGLALRGLARRRVRRVDAETENARSVLGTYLLFVGLTLLNPATVAYFVALAIGLPEIARDTGSRVAFALGAALASLSWQTLLAALGAVLRARLSPRVEVATTLLSSAILVGLALKIASDALGPS
ncbi:MAG TPA: LysE family transporter [Candidatus Limnocylindria bacterium]|nr:LysE family transporter [Candidatus Limnocylindria bacterium]